MSPGAELFVVCKNCGAEVSPYVTECPYCGSRVRRRAPKLPREGEELAEPSRRRRPKPPSLGRLRRGELAGLRPDRPPYATLAVVLAGCVAWVLWNGGFVSFDRLVIDGPLGGDAWKLVTASLTFSSGLYAFAVLFVVGVFGMLLEERHGPVVTIALFLACAVTGSLAALAAYSQPLVVGGNAAALGLLAAWAAPHLLARRAGRDTDADLLGTGALAVVVLALPLARPEACELAGVTGGLVGLVLGAGLAQLRPTV